MSWISTHLYLSDSPRIGIQTLKRCMNNMTTCYALAFVHRDWLQLFHFQSPLYHLKPATTFEWYKCMFIPIPKVVGNVRTSTWSLGHLSTCIHPLRKHSLMPACLPFWQHLTFSFPTKFREPFSSHMVVRDDDILWIYLAQSSFVHTECDTFHAVHKAKLD